MEQQNDQNQTENDEDNDKDYVDAIDMSEVDEDPQNVNSIDYQQEAYEQWMVLNNQKQQKEEEN